MHAHKILGKKQHTIKHWRERERAAVSEEEKEAKKKQKATTKLMMNGYVAKQIGKEAYAERMG